MAYRKPSAVMEKLLGNYCGAMQRRGDLVRDQRAAEDAIRRFLARYPEAHQPEDITQLETAMFLQTAADRGEKAKVLVEFGFLEDFWDYLREIEGYWIVNPFVLPSKPSRWSKPTSGRNNPFLPTSTDAVRCSFSSGRRIRESEPQKLL